MQGLEIARDPLLLGTVIRDVRALGAAYFFTGELRYAERVAQKVWAFFIDESTGMLPSMAYAGMRPGVDDVEQPAVRRPPLGAARRTAGRGAEPARSTPLPPQQCLRVYSAPRGVGVVVPMWATARRCAEQHRL